MDTELVSVEHGASEVANDMGECCRVEVTNCSASGAGTAQHDLLD